MNLKTSETVLKKKSLQEWLDFLENRHPNEIFLGLKRLEQAARSLGLLQVDAVIITVAGTNGKGSTVAILESLYTQAGFRVGCYTSPHLHCFNERIRINQKPISDSALCQAFEAIQSALGFTKLSYFEASTLAAFWHFKQYPLDVLILEIGLGGRLDAVNCWNADLGIITSIAMDHEAYLGNTLDAIAYEKAGILRAGRPFIYADFPMPKPIAEEAERLNACPLRQGMEYQYQEDEEWLLLKFQGQSFKFPASSYHKNSQAAALMASLYLNDRLPMDQKQRDAAMRQVFLPGRQQFLSSKKYGNMLFDVAHNPQAALYLAEHLRKTWPNVRIHAVFSALKDKDIVGMINALKPLMASWSIAQMPGKRAASATQLMAAMKACDVSIDLCYNDPVLALQAAYQQAGRDDLLLVFGSFVIVGLVLKEVQ